MEQDTRIFAFVLMPFDKAYDDIYKLGIKETAAGLGMLAERVDEQIFREGILERIYRQIEAADLVVADMSGQNPNVFYEVGYAHAKGKLCILITKNATDIPFDLKHHRHIVYGSSIDALRKALAEELNWARTQISTVRSSRIRVTLKDASGILEKTKYSARCTIDLEIDFHNETDGASAELEAVYFYCRKGWTLYQDGKECPSTDSDISDIQARHFLSPPLRRLHRKSWAQLKFSAKRILAFTTEGEELKDTYRLNGRSVLRLVTAEGNFDYELPLDVTVTETPF